MTTTLASYSAAVTKYFTAVRHLHKHTGHILTGASTNAYLVTILAEDIASAQCDIVALAARYRESGADAAELELDAAFREGKKASYEFKPGEAVVHHGHDDYYAGEVVRVLNEETFEFKAKASGQVKVVKACDYRHVH